MNSNNNIVQPKDYLACTMNGVGNTISFANTYKWIWSRTIIY